MKRVKIFLSYCWKDSKEADKICKYFQNDYDIELHRDIINIKKWNSIKDYMQSLDNMDYMILLISDAYLKSANCMYEVLEVMRDRNYRDRIFPAIINNGIYDPFIKIDYIKYWEDEFIKLKEKLAGLSVQNLGKLPEELKRRQDISSNIAEFLDVVSDMNNPDINDTCKEIEKKLEKEKLLGDKIRKNSPFEPIDYKIVRIIVVGVGNSGNNIINKLINEQIDGLEFIGINTDKQALQLCKAPTLLQIGEKLTKGSDAAAKPEIGESAAKESSDKIVAALKGADIVFIICGMGGGTGTGAAPVIAKLSKAMDILTIGIVTTPFSDESKKYVKNSFVGISKMIDNVDSLVVVSNDNLFDFVNEYIMIPKVFEMSDMMVLQMIVAIENLINLPGLINLDLEDVQGVMKNKGIAYVGVGKGKGDNKVIEAAMKATKIPYLGATIEGASHVIIHIFGDFSLIEVNKAANYVQEMVGDEANIIFGAMFDESEIDSCVVTVIATGMKNNKWKGGENNY